jgi:uncharacterized protein (DUF2164 family)
MVKKQTKKPEKHTSRDQYTIVLEDLRSQFGVFGESLEYVSDKVDEISDKVDKNSSHLDNIGIRLINVETELEFVKNELGIIRHNQVTRDEFRLLETRVARLERTK